MNLKVANLVAVQFGIFVGMLAWLAYSHFESGEPPRVAEENRKAPVNSVAPLAPTTEPEGQRPVPLDYRADPDRLQPVTEQPVPVVQYQYSPEAVQQYAALAAQQYYQQIAPRPYANSNLDNRSIVAAPSSAKREQEPVVVPTEYEDAPQTIAYEEPAQIVAYAQPYPFVAYSGFSRFTNRCRPAFHHRNARSTFAHQRRNNRGLHVRGPRDCRPAKSFGIVHRRTDSTPPTCRPNRGFAARGKR